MRNQRINKPSVILDDETVNRSEEFLSIMSATLSTSVMYPICAKVLMPNAKDKEKNQLYDEVVNFKRNINYMPVLTAEIDSILFFLLCQIRQSSEVARSVDGLINEKHVFKILQEGCKLGFFDTQEKLYSWAIKNPNWINRSLRVVGCEGLNEKMIDKDGYISMDLIFRHSQNQAIYWFIIGVIDLLNGKYR